MTAGQTVITYDVPSVVAAGLNPIVPVVVMDEREPGNVVPSEAVAAGCWISLPAQNFSPPTIVGWKSSSCEDANEIGSVARRRDRGAADRKPTAVLGLATGSSPLAIYDELARPLRGGPDLVPSGPRLHPRRVRRPARRPPAALPQRDRRRCSSPASTSPRAPSPGPDGLAADIPAACAATRRRSATAGGVDLQILGIGTDGHIGFNEPGSSLASRTRIKTLTRQTRIDNARFFDGDVDRGARRTA